MLALFCLRLATGLSASMLLVIRTRATPSFYRTLFLVNLGLLTVFVFFRWQSDPCVLTCVVLGAILAFIGSIVWMLEGARGKQAVIVATALSLAAGLVSRAGFVSDRSISPLPLGLDDFSSAAILGAATSAMLLGHSYLVEPSMSIAPLLRMLMGLFGAILIRMVYSGVEISYWAPGLAWSDLLVLSVAVRWAIGLLGPLVLAVLAWRCARIRSTQSATGILYVVVVLVFMGELFDQVTAAIVHEAIRGSIQ